MKNNPFTLLTSVLGLIFILFSLKTSVLAIPNPAAVFCIESGYRSENKTDSKGSQYGICIDSKKIACDQ